MEERKPVKFYYGYVITLLSFLCYFASSGILTVSSGLVINELLTTFGWSGTEVSSAFTIRSLIGLSLPFVGYITVKYGPRYVIGFSGFITTMCLIFTAYIEHPWQFVLYYGVGVSFSMLFNDYLGIFAITNNWWREKRGLHVGIVTAGGALGGVVFPIVIAFCMTNYGFTKTLWIMAGMLFFISVLPQLIFYRNFPKDMNQIVDNGYVQEAKKVDLNSSKKAKRYFSPVDWDTKDALKTPAIWLIIVIWSGLVYAYITIMFFSVNYLVTNGMSTIQASTILGAINFIAMIVSLLAGWVIDKIGSKLTLVGCALFSAAGSLMLINVSGYASGWLFAIVYGVSVGSLVPCVATITPSFYGLKNYPHIQGSVQWILALSSGVAATGVGIIIDRTGSLVPAFIIAALVSGVSCILGLALKPPKLLQKHQEILSDQKLEESTI